MVSKSPFMNLRGMVVVLVVVLLVAVLAIMLWPKKTADVPKPLPSEPLPVAKEVTESPSLKPETKSRSTPYQPKRYNLPYTPSPDATGSTPVPRVSRVEDKEEVVSLPPEPAESDESAEPKEIVFKGAEFTVTSFLASKVTEVLVEEGDRIVGPKNNGQPTLLARLDDSELKVRLAQMANQLNTLEQELALSQSKVGNLKVQCDSSQSNYQLAKSNFERLEAQSQGQNNPSPQREQARALKEAAEVKVRTDEQAYKEALEEQKKLQGQKQSLLTHQQQLVTCRGFTEIKAPFTGRVLRKAIKVGDAVSLGQVLFVLENTGAP